MSYLITNAQKRSFNVPPVVDLKSEDHRVLFPAIVIDPGATEIVPEEHWDKVREKNRVIEALLAGRHLIVNRGEDLDKAPVLQELVNPPIPVAPDDLTTPLEGVTLESKTSLVQVDLPDAPTEAPAPKSSSRKA